MPRPILALLLVASYLLVMSCAIGPGRSARIIPTEGPIEHVSGQTNLVFRRMHSSTNCAEIGDIVTFTGELANESPAPMTITTQPLIDFILRPSHGWPYEKEQGPEPIQRWSETAEYPTDINPVLQPGEKRIYRWQWRADAVYGQRGVNGVTAQFFVGRLTEKDGGGKPEGSVNIDVGVDSMAGPGPSGFSCADVRTP